MVIHGEFRHEERIVRKPTPSFCSSTSSLSSTSRSPSPRSTRRSSISSNPFVLKNQRSNSFSSFGSVGVIYSRKNSIVSHNTNTIDEDHIQWKYKMSQSHIKSNTDQHLNGDTSTTAFVDSSSYKNQYHHRKFRSISSSISSLFSSNDEQRHLKTHHEIKNNSISSHDSESLRNSIHSKIHSNQEFTSRSRKLSTSVACSLTSPTSIPVSSPSGSPSTSSPQPSPKNISAKDQHQKTSQRKLKTNYFSSQSLYIDNEYHKDQSDRAVKMNMGVVEELSEERKDYDKGLGKKYDFGDCDDDYVIATPSNSSKNQFCKPKNSLPKRSVSVTNSIFSQTGERGEEYEAEEDEEFEDDDYSCFDETITTPVIKQQSHVSLHPSNPSPKFTERSPLTVQQYKSNHNAYLSASTTGNLQPKNLFQTEPAKLKTPFYHLNPSHSLQKKKTYHHNNNKKVYRSSSLKRYSTNSNTSISNSTATSINPHDYTEPHPTFASENMNGSGSRSSNSSSGSPVFAESSAFSSNRMCSNTRVCDLIRSNSFLKKKPPIPCVTPISTSFGSTSSNASAVSTPLSTDGYTPVTPEKNNLLYKINTDCSFEASSTTSFLQSSDVEGPNNSMFNMQRNETNLWESSASISKQSASNETNQNIGMLDTSKIEYTASGIPYITCEEFQTIFTKQKQNVIVVDCRFEEEYTGGHILDSVNIDDHINMKNYFFTNSSSATTENEMKSSKNPFFSNFTNSEGNHNEKRKKSSETIVVLYCEYTKYRSPTLAQFIRRFDRNLNLEYYPELYYPNLYILKGGFFEFHQKYPQLCVGEYKPMLESTRYEEKLDRFRSNSGILLHSDHSSEIMLDMKLECVKSLDPTSKKNDVSITQYF